MTKVNLCAKGTGHILVPLNSTNSTMPSCRNSRYLGLEFCMHNARVQNSSAAAGQSNSLSGLRCTTCWAIDLLFFDSIIPNVNVNFYLSFRDETRRVVWRSLTRKDQYRQFMASSYSRLDGFSLRPMNINEFWGPGYQYQGFFHRCNSTCAQDSKICCRRFASCRCRDTHWRHEIKSCRLSTC